MLLGPYLLDWVERRRVILRPTTHASYVQVVASYLIPKLGECRLDQLDRRQLERTYAELLVAGGRGGRRLAPKTVSYCHVILHRALEDAVLDGLLGANPARQARPPRADAGMVEIDDDLQVWSASQVASFLDFVDVHPWRNLWHLAVGTGARRGELLGLRWVDVDLEAGQVRIRRSLTRAAGVTRLLGTKTSRSRTLSLGPSVLDALERERATSLPGRGGQGREWGLVFVTPAGEPIDPTHVTHEFRGLVRAAPVPVIRLHDLRHTHATLLLEAGVPIKVVSERLGHSTISMTMDTYGHVLPAMDADAAARFDDAIRRKPIEGEET